jgi:hypothetical protein
VDSSDHLGQDNSREWKDNWPWVGPGSDCISGSYWAKAVLKMVGIPGVIDIVNFAPKSLEEHNTAVPWVKNEVWRVSRTPFREWPTKLIIIDGNGGHNNFESTVVYTANGSTLYFPSGAGEFVYDNKDYVLSEIFASAAWIGPDKQVWIEYPNGYDEEGKPMFKPYVRQQVNPNKKSTL